VALPKGIVARAFEQSGEKHRYLASLAYRLLFGGRWQFGLLGFAWMKHVDHAVDRDPDAGRALRLLAAQRALVARAYKQWDGEPPPQALPERYGWELCAWDAPLGGALQPLLLEVLDAIECDVLRRGQLLDAAALERAALSVGEPTIHYFAHFAAPGRRPPAGFLRAASRAYVFADSLVDLDEDVESGLYAIPAEEIERVCLRVGHASLERWRAERAPQVLRLFEEALVEARALPWRLRLLAELMLRRKRRELLRALAPSSAATQAGAERGSR
jgi:hypothetical protein